MGERVQKGDLKFLRLIAKIKTKDICLEVTSATAQYISILSFICKTFRESKPV